MKITPSAPSASANRASSTLSRVLAALALKKVGMRPFVILITSRMISRFSSWASKVDSPAEPRMNNAPLPYLICLSISTLNAPKSTWSCLSKGVTRATQEPEGRTYGAICSSSLMSRSSVSK